MEMMKKEKSPWASKMKLLLALPIIALLVFAFAKKEYVMVNAENSLANSPLTIEKNEPQKDLIKVKGEVIDDQGKPMTGANVVLKGTNNGTVVDKMGKFTLEVPKSELAIKRKNSNGTELTIKNAQTLVVSFIGYGTHEYVFDTQNGTEEKEVNISLQRSYYNITLPEIGRNEKIVNGTIVEAPAAKISKDNAPTNDVVELPPPPKRTKDEEIFTIVEDMPYYGQSGMYELANDIKEITDNLMKQTKDRGEVLVGFTVSSEGKVTNPHVVKSSQSKILDGSAIKIVQKLDNWRPGIQRGKKVPVDLTVPVNFN
jgi:TonB family protein